MKLDSIIKEFRNNCVKHTFTFTNTGLKNLEILDIKSGCSCTVPELSDLKKVYAPGESGKIDISLTAHNPGPTKGTILVFSNSPTSPDKLQLGVDYLPKTVVKALPSKLTIKDFLSGISVASELNIEVICLEKQDINVKDIRSHTGSVVVNAKKLFQSNTKSDRGYYNHRFSLSVLPIIKKTGAFQDTLTVSFAPDLETVEIPIEGDIVDRWACIPRKAMLVWDGTTEIKPECKVVISDLMDEPFGLALVENPYPELLQIDFNAETSGKANKSIRVACRSNLYEGIKRGIIVLSITSTKHQEMLIEIPVTILNPDFCGFNSGEK